MKTRATLSFFIGMLFAALYAEVSVVKVDATQRYPWNGLVDITCKVRRRT